MNRDRPLWVKRLVEALEKRLKLAEVEGGFVQLAKADVRDMLATLSSCACGGREPVIEGDFEIDPFGVIHIPVFPVVHKRLAGKRKAHVIILLAEETA